MKLVFSVAFVAVASFASAGPVEKAVAVLAPTQGSSVAGKVTFTRVESGLRIQAELSGLKEGAHGFHVHEFGDCSAPDGTSAGGHFNPTGDVHAGPKDDKRHAGDVGNIEAGKDGLAKLDWVDPKGTLDGPNSLLGRGVIVHEKNDDLKTQPTGNAGARLACGVIGATKAP